MRLPGEITERLREAALRLCRDVLVFCAGAITACVMIGFLRRSEK